MRSMTQVVSAQIPCGVHQTQIKDGGAALEGTTVPTLSTGYQYIDRASKIQYNYFRGNSNLEDPMSITAVADNCVNGEDVYIGLRLIRLQYSDDGGTTYTEESLEGVGKYGGPSNNAPTREWYNPVYLTVDESDPYASTLVIDTTSTLYVPTPLVAGRRFKFVYDIMFETETNMFRAEKKPFRFELLIFDSPSSVKDFYQCTLLTFTYVVGPDFFDLDCLYDNSSNPEMASSDVCDVDSSVDVIYRLTNHAVGIDKEQLTKLNDGTQNSYIISINDEATDLYGSFEVTYMSQDDIYSGCAIVHVVNKCQTDLIDYNLSNPLLYEQSYTGGTTFMEVMLRASDEDFMSDSCDPSHYTYSIVGYRLDSDIVRTADSYYSVFDSIDVYGIEGLLVIEIADSAPVVTGVHTIALEAYIENFQQATGQKDAIVLLYFQIDVTVCSYDVGQTIGNYVAFMPPQQLYEVELGATQYMESELAQLLDSSLLIDYSPLCEAPTFALQLVHVASQDGSVLQAHEILTDRVTFDIASNGDVYSDPAIFGPYPLSVDPATNDLIFSASTGAEITGLYSYSLYIQLGGDLIEDIRYPYDINIRVIENGSVDSVVIQADGLTFWDIFQLVRESLPASDIIPAERPLVVFLDPIVTLFGVIESDLTAYSWSAEAVDEKNYGYGVAVDLPNGALLLGPFTEDVDSIEILITVTDTTTTASVTMSLTAPQTSPIEDNKEVDEYEVAQGQKIAISLKPYVVDATASLVGTLLMAFDQTTFHKSDLKGLVLNVQPSQLTSAQSYNYIMLIKDDLGVVSSQSFLVKVVEADDDEPPSENGVKKPQVEPPVKEPELTEEEKIEIIEEVDEFNIDEYLEKRRPKTFKRQKGFNDVLKTKSDQIRRDAERQARKEKKKTLELAHSQVSRSGDFDILFSEGLLGLLYMQGLDDFELKTTGTVSQLFADEEGAVGDAYSDIFQFTRRLLRSRQLLSDSEESLEQFDLSEYLKFELRRGGEDSSTPEDLQFEVKVERRATSELYLNVEFEKPSMVSMGQSKDMLVAEVSDELFFSRSDDSDAKVENGTQIKLWLPRLLTGDNLEQVAVAVHDVIDSTAALLVYSNVAFTLILAVSLKAMWNMFNVMQVLAYLREFTPWPAIVDQILEQIYDAITMKPIVEPLLDYGKSQFEVLKEEQFDIFANSQGVDSTSLMNNLGIFAVIGILVLLLILVFMIVARCVKTCSCCQKLKTMLKNKLFFSQKIQYVKYGYLRFMSIFATLFVMGAFKKEDTSQSSSPEETSTSSSSPEFVVTFISGFLLFVMWLCPLVNMYWLLKNYERLNDPIFYTRWSDLFKIVKTTSFSAVIYYSVFMTRRFNLVMDNVIFSKESPLLDLERTFYLEKILVFFLIQTFYLMYVHEAQPHTDPAYNKLELFNEYALTIIAYMMLIFTGLNQPISEISTKFGTTVSLVLIFVIIIRNMATLLLSSGTQVKVKSKKIRAVFRHQRQRNQTVFSSAWKSLKAGGAAAATPSAQINSQNQEDLFEIDKKNKGKKIKEDSVDIYADDDFDAKKGSSKLPKVNKLDLQDAVEKQAKLQKVKNGQDDCLTSITVIPGMAVPRLGFSTDGGNGGNPVTTTNTFAAKKKPSLASNCKIISLQPKHSAHQQALSFSQSILLPLKKASHDSLALPSRAPPTDKIKHIATLNVVGRISEHHSEASSYHSGISRVRKNSVGSAAALSVADSPRHEQPRLTANQQESDCVESFSDFENASVHAEVPKIEVDASDKKHQGGLTHDELKLLYITQQALQDDLDQDEEDDVEQSVADREAQHNILPMVASKSLHVLGMDGSATSKIKLKPSIWQLQDDSTMRRKSMMPNNVTKLDSVMRPRVFLGENSICKIEKQQSVSAMDISLKPSPNTLSIHHSGVNHPERMVMRAAPLSARGQHKAKRDIVIITISDEEYASDDTFNNNMENSQHSKHRF